MHISPMLSGLCKDEELSSLVGGGTKRDIRAPATVHVVTPMYAMLRDGFGERGVIELYVGVSNPQQSAQ